MQAQGLGNPVVEVEADVVLRHPSLHGSQNRGDGLQQIGVLDARIPELEQQSQPRHFFSQNFFGQRGIHAKSGHLGYTAQERNVVSIECARPFASESQRTRASVKSG